MKNYLNTKELLAFLIDHGYSQTEIAKRVHLAQGTISKFVAGRRHPKIEHLERIRKLCLDVAQRDKEFAQQLMDRTY